MLLGFDNNNVALPRVQLISFSAESNKQKFGYLYFKNTLKMAIIDTEKTDFIAKYIVTGLIATAQRLNIIMNKTTLTRNLILLRDARFLENRIGNRPTDGTIGIQYYGLATEASNI